MNIYIKHIRTMLFLLLGISIVSIACTIQHVHAELAKPNQLFTSKHYRFVVKPIITGLNHPWSVVWLPPVPSSDKHSKIKTKEILITERNGDILLINLLTKKKVKLFLPRKFSVYQKRQGGLLDLAIDPHYQENGWIYLSFSQRLKKKRKNTTSLARFKVNDSKLSNFEILFQASPAVRSGIQFGSRIVFSSTEEFDKKNYLYLSVGDRRQGKLIQETNNHVGKVIRFEYMENFSPEVFSYGHRNSQGMVWDESSKQLLLHEHGAKGGDEINIVEKGGNYGWPIISYGRNYNGTKIGVGTHKAGMKQPMHYWDPSIAPSGLIVYEGQEFSKWNGNLLLGSLKFGSLVRIELNKNRNKVINEERMLEGRLGRIRDISQDYEKNLYLLTDSSDGALYQISLAK